MPIHVSRLLALWASIALLACQSYPPAEPALQDPVATAIADALQSTPPDALEHDKALRLAGWLQTHVAAQSQPVKPDAAQILAEGRGDPFASAVVFMAMLKRLAIPYTVHVATGIETYGWYPIVEVNDRDGDHGIDVFGGRYVPDYDGSPLPVKAMFKGQPAHLGGPFSPSWNTLREARKLSLSSTVYYPIAVEGKYEFASHVTESTSVWGDRLYAAALTGVGDQNSLFGRYALAHKYEFPNLASNVTFRLEAHFAAAATGGLVVMAAGARPTSRKTFPGGVAYEFLSTDAAPSVTVATHDGEFVEFATLSWSRP